MAASPTRTRAGLPLRAADRIADRLLRLPRPTTGYTVTRDVAVPMRDGTTLLADHYAPVTDSPRGTVLVRVPYGRGGLVSAAIFRMYAARGYHVVIQSVRGTFGSQGVFVPGRHEVDDGADTVAWLRAQPWFTGRFATMGASYVGFTQWALLVDPPPELAAAIVTVGPHDFGAAAWGTGAFALGDLLGWSDLVAHQEDNGRIRPLMRALTASRRLRPALGEVPLGQAGRGLLGESADWYESWLRQPDTSAPLWTDTRLDAALTHSQVPVLLIGGWQDVFLIQTLEQYRRLRAAGAEVALTVGPWTHNGVGTVGAGPTGRETLDWLDTHLAAAPAASRARVRVFMTGARRWLEQSDWPPPATDTVLYPQPDATLSTDPPSASAPPSTFVYDPADPTPTVGGRLLSLAAGYRDDAELASRTDVAAFTGPVLAADLDVAGVPRVELMHSSDTGHADVFVRVSEVRADGKSVNLSDGYLRRAPGASGPLRLELDPVAHRFASGSRIRLLIAGGSHPRFDRNLGTGEPPVTGRDMLRTTHTVAHGTGSRLVLPVLSPAVSEV